MKLLTGYKENNNNIYLTSVVFWYTSHRYTRCKYTRHKYTSTGILGLGILSIEGIIQKTKIL